ncbi:proline--tRNA ligase [Candidatus Daviesbacteria bacterium RIFCSPHIGHO2_12_FULL_47_45]|nr:MAG: proline--tRNA ligase [Candidatus Daviesbacteria bacterium RIFCSPHIGHO2_12_FULL_47_45]
MKYSKLFGKTIKDTPTGATLVSHKLLYQAGFIRESTAGRYYLLPLGIRVHRKLEAIIKEEMDKAGAQQLITPVLHPLELWKETNRTTAAGFELMVIKDRNQGQFVLGGTAEEMLVDLIRKFQLSYKDLPLNLYQFSTKFRDEARARGGLLRLREFMMKDAYSFDATEADFKKEYKSMEQTYSRIFDRLDLKTLIVESDAGESKFLMTDDGKYSAHEDVAKFMRDNKNIDEEEKEMISVEAIRGTTMEDGVKLHGLPMWQQIKDLMMVDDQGRMILGVIRGDYDVNEVKLAHLAKAYTLRHATAEEIQKLGSEPGFISPVGIKQKAKANGVELLVIGDSSLRTIKNAYTGDNAKHKDLMNVNIDRDYSLDVEGDIALAKAGYSSLDGLALIEKKGIEVGNIFQLGYHYSSRMKDATFADEKGEKKPYYMGCYGIGIARTLATLVEIFNDDKGIIWPEAVAPFKVHLLGLDLEDKAIASSAQKTYELLQVEGIEVLFDDREEVRAGAKFADADLIGIPYRVVISKRSGEKLEVKRRDSSDTAFMTLPELINKLR